MYSVDRASIDFFGSLNLKPDYYIAHAGPIIAPGLSTFSYSKWLPRAGSLRSGALPLKLLSNPSQLDHYDVVVYWGDFINNPVYGAGDFCLHDVNLGHSKDAQEAKERWFRLFTGEDVSGPRLISAGNNFQHGFGSPWEKRAIRTLLQSFSHIFPRDDYSKDNLVRLRSSEMDARVGSGIDLALLQNDIEPRARHGFSYFFGRSGLRQVDWLLKRLSTALGVSPSPLANWFRLKRFRREARFLQLRNLLASSKFCVTDAYHVAVNSLAVGTPVICIGRPVENQLGTLGDFKKKKLYEMFQMRALYFEIDDERGELGCYEDIARYVCLGSKANGFVEFRRARELLADRKEAFSLALSEAICESRGS